MLTELRLLAVRACSGVCFRWLEPRVWLEGLDIRRSDLCHQALNSRADLLGGIKDMFV